MYSPGSLVSFTKKTDCHDITEILLKVALNTINQTKPVINVALHLSCLVKSDHISFITPQDLPIFFRLYNIIVC